MSKQGMLIIACAIALVTISAVIFFTFPTADAQRAVSARFEYAVINGSYSGAPAEGPGSASASVNICYLQTAGCQNEEVRTDVSVSKFLQDERLENSAKNRSLAQERAVQTSFARAIAKLGAEGWEIVTAPAIEFDIYYTNQQSIPTVKEGLRTDRQHVWFKRLRP